MVSITIPTVSITPPNLNNPFLGIDKYEHVLCNSMLLFASDTKIYKVYIIAMFVFCLYYTI